MYTGARLLHMSPCRTPDYSQNLALELIILQVCTVNDMKASARAHAGHTSHAGFKYQKPAQGMRSSSRSSEGAVPQVAEMLQCLAAVPLYMLQRVGRR